MLAASLNAFFCASPIYGFAEDFTSLLDVTASRERNARCEAASRRNEKKAFSAAASFFPFRQLLRDYQGRVALDSCLPRLESSGHFSGSLLVRKRELSSNAKALCPAHRRDMHIKTQRKIDNNEPFRRLRCYRHRCRTCGH